MLARSTALFALALAVTAPSPAAAGGDDRALSLSLSYATFDAEEHDPDGAVLGVDYERGLSDSVALRASAGAGVYCDPCTAYSAQLSAGLTYALDVLKYIPYATVGVGALAVHGSAIDTELRPIVEVGAGLDVLNSRSLSWGPSARVEYFPGQRAFATVGLRMSWRWGFF